MATKLEPTYVRMRGRLTQPVQPPSRVIENGQRQVEVTTSSRGAARIARQRVRDDYRNRPTPPVPLRAAAVASCVTP